MLTYRYINKNQQPSSVSYSLLIEDDTKLLFQDTIRIEKTFKIDARMIDGEFLRAEAVKETDRIKYELENPVEIPSLEEVVIPEEEPNGDPIE